MSYLARLLGMRVIPAGATVLPAGWMMFDPAQAKALGINKAIIFQKIDGWVQHNRRKGKNVRNGRAWSYNTIPNWGQEFAWLNSDYVGKLIRDLESAGLLVSAKLNKKKSDQTKHYSTAAGIVPQPDPEQLSFWPEEKITLRGRNAQNDSSTGSSKSKPAKSTPKQTPTPARVTVGGGVAEFPGHVPGSEMPEKLPEVAETATDRRDGSDLEGVDESRPTRTPNTPTPVPPNPFPDDTTEELEDTEPVSVPEWAAQINRPAPSIAQLFAEHGDSLAGWYAYGQAQATIHNPVGFALSKVKQGLKPPVAAETFSNQDGQYYITGPLADFIEH